MSQSLGLSPQKNGKATELYNKSTISNFHIQQSPNPKADFFSAVSKLDERKLAKSRFTQNIKVIEPSSDEDDDGPELFIA